MYQARLATINREFCHALDNNGDRIFIHQSEADFHVGEANVGDLVEIGEIEEGPKGLRGRQVRWLERPAPETLTGTVAHIDHTKKYGFLRPEGATGIGTNRSHDDLMFHQSDCGDYDGQHSPTFDSLVRGDAVTGIVHDTPRGKRASQVWRG
jgi:cold shock CspA family protein